MLFLHFDTRNYVLSVGAAGGLLALLSTGSHWTYSSAVWTVWRQSPWLL